MRSTAYQAGLKPEAWVKRRTQKQIRQDQPPAPRGCEWRRSEEGWNLWFIYKDDQQQKKSRYVLHLSHDAWQVMKEQGVDAYEAHFAEIGKQLRNGTYNGKSLRSV